MRQHAFSRVRLQARRALRDARDQVEVREGTPFALLVMRSTCLGATTGLWGWVMGMGCGDWLWGWVMRMGCGYGLWGW
eukprot:15476995-Alexandrium_andersonii.AAC.1